MCASYVLDKRGRVIKNGKGEVDFAEEAKGTECGGSIAPALAHYLETGSPAEISDLGVGEGWMR